MRVHGVIRGVILGLARRNRLHAMEATDLLSKTFTHSHEYIMIMSLAHRREPEPQTPTPNTKPA